MSRIGSTFSFAGIRLATNASVFKMRQCKIAPLEILVENVIRGGGHFAQTNLRLRALAEPVKAG
jgi:NAD(P)H-dependent flavin oxidoreductase YrpB (nitropropane dioxygenase family)